MPFTALLWLTFLTVAVVTLLLLVRDAHREIGRLRRDVEMLKAGNPGRRLP